MCCGSCGKRVAFSKPLWTAAPFRPSKRRWESRRLFHGRGRGGSFHSTLVSRKFALTRRRESTPAIRKKGVISAVVARGSATPRVLHRRVRALEANCDRGDGDRSPGAAAYSPRIGEHVADRIAGARADAPTLTSSSSHRRGRVRRGGRPLSPAPRTERDPAARSGGDEVLGAGEHPLLVGDDLARHRGGGDGQR